MIAPDFSPGLEVVYDYDDEKLGLLKAITQPVSVVDTRTTSFSQDKAGRMKTREDLPAGQSGNQWAYGYSDGRLATYGDPEGGGYDLVRNDNGAVTGVTWPGDESPSQSYAYDEWLDGALALEHDYDYDDSGSTSLHSGTRQEIRPRGFTQWVWRANTVREH